MTYRVLIYVQHLLGIGHLVRTYRIAASLAERFEVTIVNGGEPAPGLGHGAARLHQLAPLKTGTQGFADLVHPDGRPFAAEDQARRRQDLLACFDCVSPHAMIIEAFPFGRRQMRFELLPLLDHAKRAAMPPLIACSVRDILQEARKPARAAETAELVERYFDRVLVHGTPDFAGLDETFALAPRLADRLVYTGLVGPPRPQSGESLPAHDIIVSAGGGAVGAELVACALELRRNVRFRTRWLVITGPNFPAAAFDRLERGLDCLVTLKRFAPDLPDLLCHAALSISQAGYNTVADLLAARCRAVLVPFAGDGETEQRQRAQRLSARGLAVALDPQDLTPERLADAVDAARKLARPDSGLSLDGAARTRDLIMAALAARFSTAQSA
jgi:predicted glycosyltransferase